MCNTIRYRDRKTIVSKSSYELEDRKMSVWKKGSLPNTPEDDISKGDEPFDPRSKGKAF